MSSVAILTTGSRAITGVHGVLCVPPLVTSFMPVASFEHQLAGSKNVIDASADADVAYLGIVVGQQRG